MQKGLIGPIQMYKTHSTERPLEIGTKTAKETRTDDFVIEDILDRDFDLDAADAERLEVSRSEVALVQFCADRGSEGVGLS